MNLLDVLISIQKGLNVEITSLSVYDISGPEVKTSPSAQPPTMLFAEQPKATIAETSTADADTLQFKVSPAARELASERGVPLNEIEAANGKQITKRDVQLFLKNSDEDYVLNEDFFLKNSDEDSGVAAPAAQQKEDQQEQKQNPAVNGNPNFESPTVEDVRKTLTLLLKGKGAVYAKELLAEHGATNLSSLAPETYAAFIVSAGKALQA